MKFTTHARQWKQTGPRTKLKQYRWIIVKRRRGSKSTPGYRDAIMITDGKHTGSRAGLPYHWWIVCCGDN